VDNLWITFQKLLFSPNIFLAEYPQTPLFIWFFRVFLDSVIFLTIFLQPVDNYLCTPLVSILFLPRFPRYYVENLFYVFHILSKVSPYYFYACPQSYPLFPHSYQHPVSSFPFQY